MKKDPLLARAIANRPKDQVKTGEKIGSFTFLKFELVGKNKTWVTECVCGGQKRFWKKSAIIRQTTCGCGTDENGLTKQKRRMLKSRFHSYKTGAKKRGFVWSLTLKNFHDISSQNCVYCGAEPKSVNYFENAPSLKKDSPNRNWGDYTIIFNGIDRVDSSIGYVVKNCVACCTKCNRAKNDMSIPEFKKHVTKMYEWLLKNEINNPMVKS